MAAIAMIFARSLTIARRADIIRHRSWDASFTRPSFFEFSHRIAPDGLKNKE